MYACSILTYPLHIPLKVDMLKGTPVAARLVLFFPFAEPIRGAAT